MGAVAILVAGLPFNLKENQVFLGLLGIKDVFENLNLKGLIKAVSRMTVRY